MTEQIHYKAMTLLKRGKVQLESADHGHLVFTVDKYTVYRQSNHAWSCSAGRVIRASDGHFKPVGCVIFGNKPDRLCSHCLAAKMWLEEHKNVK